MFEHPLTPFSNTTFSSECCSEKNLYARRYNTAINRFKSIRSKGKFLRVFAKILRRRTCLHDLNEIKNGLCLHGSSYAGIRVVRIRSIIGSEGKVADFDMGFHPIHESSRERWVNMAMAYLSCLPLPPVQLIQIGDAYFVRDGHHRISVARALGQTCIDAEVVTWKTTSSLPWERESGLENIETLKQAKHLYT